MLCTLARFTLFCLKFFIKYLLYTLMCLCDCQCIVCTYVPDNEWFRLQQPYQSRALTPARPVLSTIDFHYNHNLTTNEMMNMLVKQPAHKERIETRFTYRPLNIQTAFTISNAKSFLPQIYIVKILGLTKCVETCSYLWHNDNVFWLPCKLPDRLLQGCNPVRARSSA